jgi:hypothetical protein
LQIKIPLVFPLFQRGKGFTPHVNSLPQGERKRERDDNKKKRGAFTPPFIIFAVLLLYFVCVP